jgi:hypothetical protein
MLPWAAVAGQNWNPCKHYLKKRNFFRHAIHVLCSVNILVILLVLLQRKNKFVLVFIITLLRKCLHVNNFFSVSGDSWFWTCDLVNTGLQCYQPAGFSVRTILKLFFPCAIGSSCGGFTICSLAVVTTNCSISSHPVFFLHSEGFWPWSIALGVTGFLEFIRHPEF